MRFGLSVCVVMTHLPLCVHRFSFSVAAAARTSADACKHFTSLVNICMHMGFLFSVCLGVLDSKISRMNLSIISVDLYRFSHLLTTLIAFSVVFAELIV